MTLRPSAPDDSPTRVAVIGVGAVGTVFAAALQETSRAEVALCARRSLGPVSVEGVDGRVTTLDAPLLTEPDAVRQSVDWVLLAVKAHQTSGAAGWLRRLLDDRTRILVLQNGVDHVDRLSPYADSDAIVPSVLWCPSDPVSAGRVRQRGRARILLPDADGGRAAAALLAGSRVEVEVTRDFATAAWRKLTLNAVTGLMALTGRGAHMFREANVQQLARRLARECAAVARSEGARLTDEEARRLVVELAEQPNDSGSSILADRLHGRPLEWEARNAIVQRRGALHGIATPISDVLVPLLRSYSLGVESHSEAVFPLRGELSVEEVGKAV